MQTFLPYPDFAACAAALDDRRLGKQRVEAYQILRATQGLTRGWRNHPAVNMWRGYEDALGLYMNAMIDEWERRGFKNNMTRHSIAADVAMPPWLGHPNLHASHRSNLLRKAPAHYSQLGWAEPPTLPYFWPEGTTTSPVVERITAEFVGVSGGS